MFEFFKSKSPDEKGKNRKLWILIAGAAVGILLLLWGGSTDNKGNASNESVYDPKSDELMIYKAYLEDEIKKLCESVNGVEHVTVSVTLSGSFEEVYATEYREEGEEYVILGSGASASPLYLTRATPTIAGVGIVCTGGGSERVKNTLIPLISTTLSVSTNRIYIAEARK